MNKVWDVESNKFVEVNNNNLSIRREATDTKNPNHYVSSFELCLAQNKTKEIMSKIATLWNNSDTERLNFNMEKIIIEENRTYVKISVFFDEDKKEHFMKFRVIGKDDEGGKNIDFIKLNRPKSRELYAYLYTGIAK